jgi:hypothetical protein
MSDEETPAPPAAPEPPVPVVPGFEIVLAENELWTINAKGESPWYVTGFETPSNAHEWLLDYLTINFANSIRLQAKMQERQRRADEAQKQALAESMFWSESASRDKKGKIH